MGELRLTDVDETVLRDLRTRAAGHGRTPAQEAKAILTEAVRGSLPEVGPTLAQATETVEARFRSLVKQWKRETEAQSSIRRMIQHPAYQEIIGLGEPAVPLLLAELKRNPDFWFAALQTLTGAKPAPPETAGNVNLIARAWIEWGTDKGYLK